MNSVTFENMKPSVEDHLHHSLFCIGVDELSEHGAKESLKLAHEALILKDRVIGELMRIVILGGQ